METDESKTSKSWISQQNSSTLRQGLFPPKKKSRVGKRVKTFSNNCHILYSVQQRIIDIMIQWWKSKGTKQQHPCGEMGWFMTWPVATCSNKNRCLFTWPMCIWYYLVGFIWVGFLCQLPSQRFSSFPGDDITKKLVTVGASTSSTCSWRGLKKRALNIYWVAWFPIAIYQKLYTPLGFNISLLSRHFWVDDFPRLSLGIWTNHSLEGNLSSPASYIPTTWQNKS